MSRELRTVLESMLRRYPQMKAEARSGPLLIWCAVIEEMLVELGERPERRRMVELRYFDGMTEEAVMQALPLGRSCYRKWRDDALATLAAKAAYERLIKP